MGISENDGCSLTKTGIPDDAANIFTALPLHFARLHVVQKRATPARVTDVAEEVLKSIFEALPLKTFDEYVKTAHGTKSEHVGTASIQQLVNDPDTDLNREAVARFDGRITEFNREILAIPPTIENLPHIEAITTVFFADMRAIMGI